MTILALDPGPVVTGCIKLNVDGHVLHASVLRNAEVLDALAQARPPARLAIEWFSSFGMPVGAEVFNTCLWVGRFVQTWFAPETVMLIPRSEVKLRLCGSARAKDPSVRQALIDLFPATGGGDVPQIGNAKRHGPLYGVHTHAWSALAVAIVAAAKIARETGRPLPALVEPMALERIA
jgi:hypothetical protein